MDEEKQTPNADDKENESLNAPSDDIKAESQDSEAAETSPQGDDLAMPDMDMPKTEASDKEQAASTADDEPQPESTSEESVSTQADSDEQSDKVVNPEDESEEGAEAAMMKMMEEEAAGGTQESEIPDTSIDSGSQPVVEKVAFQPLRSEGKSESKNLNILFDVTLPIAIELGRTSMAIEDILNLGPGSVVELDKLAGEPVDLLINNKLLAKGEVVVIDENFGVRITSMISPQDRIRNLQ